MENLFYFFLYSFFRFRITENNSIIIAKFFVNAKIFIDDFFGISYLTGTEKNFLFNL